MSDAPAILILAAGAARRMRGADKLLHPVDGVAQLRRIADAALATGWRVLVALPPDRPDRAAVLEGLPVVVVAVRDADQGMSASIRAGVMAAGAVPLLMVLPADMPELDAADLIAVARMAQANPDCITRAVAGDGTAGHPVVFPADLLPSLQQLAGDEGARAILRHRAADVIAVPLPGAHATRDLDTPEEWAAWMAARRRH